MAKKKGKKVVVVNVRLPENIISWIDSLVELNVYNSRSEAVREFSRRYILKAKTKSNKSIGGEENSR
ncbi:MAG: ribbon-helix-helix domain-containing protein [Nanoarchaeota archaeon]|nr:ribbon-helix-helix domain-containing protein [Nanoarchaeota archaeon]